MDRHGFTIVELIITITIMAILLSLGVVNLIDSQANSRDSERKTDIETISLHLESYYNSGNDISTSVGQYPWIDAATGLVGHETDFLRDIDTKSLTAPGETTTSLVAATNITQTTVGVTPQPAVNQYVYQPLKQDGTLCTASAQLCQKFNLFYKLEVDNIVYMVTSKNQ